MGRVRRYKKAKNLDITSKRKRADKKDVEHNLPPDTANHQAQRLKADGTLKRRAKQRLPEWAKEELRETAKREREADKQLLAGAAATPLPGENDTPKVKITPKRTDESLREFNERVRKVAAEALKDNAKRASSTVARRKKHLAEKSQKKKLQRQGLWEEHKMQVAREEQGIAEERDFSKPEHIQFGETVHEPPRFQSMPKLKGLKPDLAEKPWLRGLRSDAITGLKRKAGGGGKGEGEGDGVLSAEGAQLKAQQLERVRTEAVAAYADLKKRRRAGQVQHVAHDNL
ncbi:hypothetical protein JKP88DRAFT_263379 [Tribonema minus]|uniref:Uncharacterized protein n=1 Tax=Tribonema minus TaxID=303371 RepID=A0A835YUV8_9STRA|nr:hypothetical protein JKP88DRAFT_263379 [Tribonema minus]